MVTSKQWRSRELSETVAGTSANNAGSYARTHTIQTTCRQCTDEMDFPRFRGGEVQSPFYRAMRRTVSWKIGGVWRNSSCTSSRGRGSGNPAPKLADRWKSGVWLGKSDLTDEHLVRTDDGAVHARSVRRLAENRWSEENLTVDETQKPRSMTDEAADRVVPEAHERIQTKRRPMRALPGQTTRIMKWRWRRFQSQTQQRCRAQAEERNAQKHKKTCSSKDG